MSTEKSAIKGFRLETNVLELSGKDVMKIGCGLQALAALMQSVDPGKADGLEMPILRGLGDLLEGIADRAVDRGFQIESQVFMMRKQAAEAMIAATSLEGSPEERERELMRLFAPV